jgi:hypothetical protein
MKNGSSTCRWCTARPKSSSASSRHGPTGTVELQFEASLTRFGDLARDSHLLERAY